MAVRTLYGALYKSLFSIAGIVNGLVNRTADGVLQIGTLAISATPEDFKTTTTLYWRRLGIQFSKTATDTLAFASAYTINTGAAAGSFWGAFLVETTDGGTITAKAVSADQVYTTEALAIAALPSATAGSVAIGYITVNANDDTDWVANTDDLTDASDCATASFYDATPVTSTALDTVTFSGPGTPT